MDCYHPLRAWQRGAAAPVFSCPPGTGYRVLSLPCGQCVGCRLAHSREWAVRCVHESKLHAENCMLTLTYSDGCLPADLSLNHSHFQLFMKRFREKVAPARIRFYMCGEYGEKGSRPHYHAIVFGFNPIDRVYFRTSDAGFKAYTSVIMDDLWKLGRVYVGDVSFESAAYVARYVMKKVGSDGAMRQILDVTTGEIIFREHEYSRMSLKPGIGALWFDKFMTDVFPHDRVVVRGSKLRVPKYYDKLFAVEHPEELSLIKIARMARADREAARLAEANWSDRFQDLQRLDVHERVKLASIRSLKRR